MIWIMDHGDTGFIVSVNYANQPYTKENSKSEIKDIIIEYSKSTVLLVQLQLQLYQSFTVFFTCSLAPRW